MPTTLTQLGQCLLAFFHNQKYCVSHSYTEVACSTRSDIFWVTICSVGVDATLLLSTLNDSIWRPNDEIPTTTTYISHSFVLCYLSPRRPYQSIEVVVDWSLLPVINLMYIISLTCSTTILVWMSTFLVWEISLPESDARVDLSQILLSWIGVVDKIFLVVIGFGTLNNKTYKFIKLK